MKGSFVYITIVLVGFAKACRKLTKIRSNYPIVLCIELSGFLSMVAAPNVLEDQKINASRNILI